MNTIIIMPQLGESVVDGTVAEWLKQPGDTVAEYESILRVSTDKVDTEIPSPASGILTDIYVEAGKTVNAGVQLGVIVSEGGAAQTVAPTTSTHTSTPARPAAPAAKPDRPAASTHVTPVVARMVQEHQLDLSRITGSGRDGRITKKDVEAYLADGQASSASPELPPWEQPGTGDLFKSTSEYGAPPAPSAPKPPPAPVAAKPQPVGNAHPVPHEQIPITALRRRIAEHMVHSKHTSPHVTTVFEVDLSAVVRHRQANRDAYEAQGVRLTFTPYFVQAIARALATYPLLNASWTDENILAFRVMNLGIATATDDGLIVPVLKNAQDYNLMGLARQITDLAQRARARQLRPDDITGGTFTLTNHGISGSLFATPIINQPQVGILGVGAIEKRVKVIGDAMAIRPCAYLSLTFDHRVADGAYADGFMTDLTALLADWPQNA